MKTTEFFKAGITALIFSASLLAQSSITGSIVSTSSDCGKTGSCVKLHFPYNSSLTPGSLSVTVTGTYSATLEFEQSADNGATWVSASGSPQPSGTSATNTTSTGLWVFSVGSRTDFRVRASAYVSGTAKVVIQSSPANVSKTRGGELYLALSNLSLRAGTTTRKIHGD